MFFRVKALISTYAHIHNEREFYDSQLSLYMPMPVPEYVSVFILGFEFELFGILQC